MEKILIISAYFFPEQFKSTDLARSLKKKKINVTVLTGLPNYPEGKIYKGYSNQRNIGHDVFEGIKIWRMPTYPRGKSKLNLILNYLSLLIFYGLFSLIYLRFKNFNKIIFIGFSPGILAYINIFYKRIFHKSPKSILWLQDFWPDDLVSTGFFQNNSYFVKLNFYLMKIIYKSFTKLAATSKGMSEELKIRTNKNVECIFNPVEEELYDLSKANFSPREKSLNKLKIMFAGNVSGNQNIENILEAFKDKEIREICEIHFFSHGARSIGLVEKMAEDYPQNIIIRGFFPLRKLCMASDDFDFGLVSLSNFSNLKKILPSRVQTLVSMGLPILSFGVPEMEALINKYNNGIVATDCSPESLRKTVMNANKLENSQIRIFSQNSFLLARDLFSLDEITDKFIEL